MLKGPFIRPRKRFFLYLLTTPFEDVKVVILGQDPSSRQVKRRGLSFFCSDSIPAPPSLQNILKESCSDDIGVKKSHDLTVWAELRSLASLSLVWDFGSCWINNGRWSDMGTLRMPDSGGQSTRQTSRFGTLGELMHARSQKVLSHNPHHF